MEAPAPSQKNDEGEDNDVQRVVGPRQAGIASPTGGTTEDVEARTAIDSILAALRAHGLIE